jgi:hypothetical protein
MTRSRRAWPQRRLRFVYFDGNAPRVLTLGEVREFKDA